jgi:hypothetical protein
MQHLFARAGFVALLIGSSWLGGCSHGGDGGNPPPPPVPHPLDVLGQDCVGCHEHATWDFVALHDRSHPQYDADCIKCHGTLLGEETLAPDRPGPHTRMLPAFLALGQVEPTNADCVWCHYHTDLVQESGGDLRRQVYVSWCWGCHRESGPYLPVLYPD